MSTTEIRIKVKGRVSDEIASSLGLSVEPADGDFELVGPYIDQPQLTGLLVQLADLHISFDHVTVIEPNEDSRAANSAHQAAEEVVLYQDQTISMDDQTITINHYSADRRRKHISLSDVRQARLITLRFLTGRHRLVGISPGRPRTYFHWDRHRRHKRVGIELDTGRTLRIGLTPADPDTVMKLIRARMPQPLETSKTSKTSKTSFIGRVLSRQAGHPTGLLGRTIGRVMVSDTKAINRAAIDVVDAQRGERILEIGFGPGRTVAALAQQGADVVGVEVSEAMGAQAQAHNRDAIVQGRVELLVGDGIKLPLPSESVNAAVSVHTIYFWPSVEGMIGEALRVLKPGGRIVLAFNAGEEEVPSRFDRQIYQFHTTASVIGVLEAAGFENIADATPPRLDARQRLVRASKPK